jgi:hypothetical protein
MFLLAGSVCLISALASALERKWDVRELRAIDSEKKQRNSPSRATEERNALRHGHIEV